MMPDPVDAAEIASRLRNPDTGQPFGRPSVEQWNRRHPDFPEPRWNRARKLWDWGLDIVPWLIATGRAAMLPPTDGLLFVQRNDTDQPTFMPCLPDMAGLPGVIPGADLPTMTQARAEAVATEADEATGQAAGYLLAVCESLLQFTRLGEECQPLRAVVDLLRRRVAGERVPAHEWRAASLHAAGWSQRVWPTPWGPELSYTAHVAAMTFVQSHPRIDLSVRLFDTAAEAAVRGEHIGMSHAARNAEMRRWRSWVQEQRGVASVS